MTERVAGQNDTMVRNRPLYCLICTAILPYTLVNL